MAATVTDLEYFTSALPDDYAAFDIVNVAPRLWPHVFVMHVRDDQRFQIALTGSHIDRNVRRNCAGLFLDQIVHGPKSDDVLQFFEKVAAEKRPMKVRHILALPDRPHLTVTATAKPYYKGQGKAAHLIGAMLFSASRAADIHHVSFEIQELHHAFSEINTAR